MLGYTGRTCGTFDSLVYVVFVINSTICLLVAPTRLEWTERALVFYLKLHLLKGTVGENCGVSGEVQFGGKDIPVV